MSELEFTRAFADHTGICQPCLQETNRLVAFRPKGNARWDVIFLCDDCLDAIKKMPTRKAADG